VAEIDTTLVLEAFGPIWTEKPETAGRLRGRIERILDWAKVRGHRSGDNPARWRGQLDKLLPAQRKGKRVRHHPALAIAEVPAFMAALAARDSLSARALALLKALPRAAGNPHVFAGPRPGEGLSNMAMLQLLRGMEGGAGLTVHGFRSTFRDWAAERTAFANQVMEQALAHTVPDKVEAAYRRGDLFDKRRRLMEARAAYCGSPPARGELVPLRAGSSVPSPGRRSPPSSRPCARPAGASGRRSSLWRPPAWRWRRLRPASVTCAGPSCLPWRKCGCVASCSSSCTG
jgi:integrase